MSQGTTFRILAEDLTGKKLHSKEDVHSRYLNELKHSFYSEKTDADFEDDIEKNGMAPFIEVRNDETKDDKKFRVLPEQKEDPFPVWLNTETGNEAYEVLSEDFMSDFMELADYLHITGTGADECVEITKGDAKKLLRVVDYILAGKYSRDVEEVLFEDNEFFDVLNEQFFHFSMRFKNKKKKSASQQIIRIVIEDKRADVESEEKYVDDDDSDLEEERLESERSERQTAMNLRDVLIAFLMMGSRWSYREDKANVKYHLVYYRWF